MSHGADRAPKGGRSAVDAPNGRSRSRATPTKPVAKARTTGPLPSKASAGRGTQRSTQHSTAPREPSEVAVLMQDPMTRAKFLSDLARETEPLEDHAGGDLHRDWVMSQYAEADNLMLGPSPRSRPATQLNDTDTMAGIVMDQLASGHYDTDYAEYLQHNLQRTRPEDVAPSKRQHALRHGPSKPYALSGKSYETDHGQELQHRGLDDGPNYRMIDPLLHREKTRALGRITKQYRDDPVKDLELDGDQIDHIAEVDLSDPNVGYYSDTYGWDSDDHLTDGDDEMLPSELISYDDPLTRLIQMEDD